MVAAVLQEKYKELVEKAVIQSNEDIVYKSVVEKNDLWTELEKLNRIDIDILMIDLEIALDYKNALQAIKNYRMLKDLTRIIIICKNRNYGDRTISELVKLGIYDIIIDNEKICENLIKVIKEKTSYAKAQKWSVEDNFVKERKISTENFIGSVTVGVGGILNGCGTTHITLALAEFLSKKGKTAIVELNNPNSSIFELKKVYKTYSIENIQGDIYNNNIGFNMAGIDFYKETDIIEVIKRQYNYIIFDCGTVNNNENEIYRCNVKILNVKSHIWENSKLLEFFNKEKDFTTWNIYSSFADKECIDYIKENLKMYKVFSIPEIKLFKLSNEIQSIFYNTLENYVEKPKKRFRLIR